MASVLRRGSRVGAGSVLAHCDVGILATVGAGCLLHDVDLANGADVPPGVFLHCVPLRPEAEEGMRGGGAALFGGGEGRRAAPSEGPSGRGGKRKGRRTLRRGLGAGAWTCIVLDVRDEVKSATASTLCGVPVAEAARRLGLDPSAGAAVWADGEARTTTNARVFPVRASAADAVAAALETRRAIKKPAGGAAGSHHGGAPTTIPSASSPPPAAGAASLAGLRVSIAEALRVLADHAAAPSAVGGGVTTRMRCVHPSEHRSVHTLHADHSPTRQSTREDTTLTVAPCTRVVTPERRKKPGMVMVEACPDL